METNEIKKLEYLQKLITLHFRTLKPTNDQSKTYTAQIKVQNYFELGCIITDMLKLCILALNDNANIEKDKSKAIDVALILETVLSIFPLDEFELITEINEVMINEYK